MKQLSFRKLLITPVLGLIWLYQKLISPLLPASCIYHPSCSHYAQIALHKHGLFKGTSLSIWRILRCQPFCQGGIDEVPERFTFFKS